MQLVVDSRLKHRVEAHDAAPLVFEPHVNWNTFSGPNIIHDY